MPSLSLRGLTWRVRAASRWVVSDIGRRAVECVARIPMLRRVPRALVVPFERALIEGRKGAFDAEFYGGAQALSHYLAEGWRQGRAPGPGFDDAAYRRASGLAATTPVSALAHYLAIGKRQGLDPRARPTPADMGHAPRDPARLLHRLRHVKGRKSATAQVDIVMPVYAGLAETIDAIYHVLSARCTTDFNLIVVDDHGPDKRLRRLLVRLAHRGLFDLIRHDRNRGFAAAITTGCARNPDRDVVWLNADTQVFDGWLDRLRRAALDAPDIATVTPLTNNGTICSYPRIDVENPQPAEIAADALDRLAARVNAGETVEAPTAVGFATYVTRSAYRAVGELDVEGFGQGYGEENDFSRRAIGLGWRNVIATDVYVHHVGATSFGTRRAGRIDRAMKVLARRYPSYLRDVHRFLNEDPLFDARMRLDRGRLLKKCGPRNVLIVTHNRGGGTEQHVQEEIARLRADGASVFVLRGGADGQGSAALGHVEMDELPTLMALKPDSAQLWQIVDALDLHEVHVHHLIDFGAGAASLFADRLAVLGVPVDVMVHDYLPVCPRINLADRVGMYCGEPDTAGCGKCLRRRGSEFGRVDITHWRQAYARLLSGARRVSVPDADVARRLARYFPEIAIDVVPHETLILPPPHRSRPHAGPLDIAVIGAIGPIKGFDVLLDLAAHGRAHNRCRITVIGHTRCDRTARETGIRVTGRYDNADLPGLIAKTNPDVIFLPSIWPETYGYTLSHALLSGYPVAVFDIGAMANRVRTAGRGVLIPLSQARDAAAVLASLEKAADRHKPMIAA